VWEYLLQEGIGKGRCCMVCFLVLMRNMTILLHLENCGKRRNRSSGENSYLILWTSSGLENMASKGSLPSL
jgi:hypothetical protein